jgi:crescentin
MMLLSKIDRALSGSARTDKRQAAASPVNPAVASTAGVIGERYETIQGSLEQLAGLAEAFRSFEPLLDTMRKPLNAEFEARRDEYLELLNLRGLHQEQAERIEGLAGENRRLTTALAALESRQEEGEAHKEEQVAAALEARLEVDRLRNALSQAEAQAEAARSAGQDSAQRVVQLEQDQKSLRDQLAEIEGHRSEADTGRARAVRDHTLASDENVALRKRLDEIGTEVARLARSEASLDSQLTAERARAAADQAESARSLRVLESQNEATRSETSALQVKVDTATSRADRLETLNADLSTRLAEIQATSQTADRRGADLQTSLYRALERVSELEAAADEARQRQGTVDAARLAAVDRAEHVTKASQAHEKALARSEDRVAKLQGQISTLQADHAAQVAALGEQVAELKASMESARAESAMIAAALETARRERSGRESSRVLVAG